MFALGLCRVIIATSDDRCSRGNGGRKRQHGYDHPTAFRTALDERVVDEPPYPPF